MYFVINSFSLNYTKRDIQIHHKEAKHIHLVEHWQQPFYKYCSYSRNLTCPQHSIQVALIILVDILY